MKPNKIRRYHSCICGNLIEEQNGRVINRDWEGQGEDRK
jgi:hypothetical protein